MPARAVQVKARPRSTKIHGALVIAAYSIVSGGGNLDSATPLILTAMPLKLMERRRRPI
jgi:hypothetical protein